MVGRLAVPFTTPPCRGCPCRGASRIAGQAATERVDIVVAEDQRRGETHRVRSRRIDDEPVRPGSRHDGRGVACDVEPDQQPPPACPRDARVVGQAGEHPLAEVGHAVEQVLLLDRVENRERGGTRDRVATERRAVVATLQRCGADPRARQAPIGMPPPRPFARVMTSGTMCRDRARTMRRSGRCRLEPRRARVAHRASRCPRRQRGTRRRRYDAGLAEGWLEEDGSRRVVHRGGQRIGVAVRHECHVARTAQTARGWRPCRLVRAHRACDRGTIVPLPPGASAVGAPADLIAASLASPRSWQRNLAACLSASDLRAAGREPFGQEIWGCDVEVRGVRELRPVARRPRQRAGCACPSEETAMPPSRSR